MKARLRKVVLAVLAATTPALAEQAVVVDKIEVTGSRIATSSDSESASPVAVIRAQDLKLDGFQSLELLLNNYPQFFADQGSRLSNGATGTATANLRALGPARTLVLFNGKRMPAGGPWTLSPDLNQIPPQMIQRVEVLTGGASAIYGSDAIAGVVNFIMNDRFEGVQGDVAFSFYNHNQKNEFAQDLLRRRNIAIPGDKAMDGESGRASFTLGSNFAQDKGNATVSFRYFKSEALLQSDRDYSACPIVLFEGAPPGCGGSSAGWPGRFTDWGFFAADPTIDIRAPRNYTIDSATGRVRTFSNALDSYNYAPTNYYQRPQERYGFNAFAHYDVAPQARVYAEFGYHDDRTIAQIAPTAVFFLTLPARWENPMLTDEWRSRLVFRNAETGAIQTGPETVANVEISRRNVDGGPRQADVRHTSFREVIGIKGQAGSHWDYDLFFQESRVNYQQVFKNDYSLSRLARGLDVVAHPVTGAPVCVSALNGTDPACVPYNVWILNGVTPEASAYASVSAFQRALTSQRVLGGTATANLSDYGIRLPRTRAGIEVAMGFERRTEKINFEADTQFADLAGSSPVRDVKGGLTVTDFFGEARVPVLDVVNLSGSYRRSSYDSGFTTGTFGLGFNAAPTKHSRIRGSYQKAVRAPNVRELFQPQEPGQYGLDGGDPCAGASPARSLSDCGRTGVTAAQYGLIIDSPFEGYRSTIGGNPELTPETAKTFTAGLVLTPTKDLSMTLDYFDMRIDNTVGAIDGGLIFQQCIDTGDPFFCRLITRDPASGALWYGGANVVAIDQNIGKTHVAGADIALNYRLRLGKGHVVAFDGLGTWLHKQSVEPYPGAPSSNCVGLFASLCADVPLPKWRHRLRVSWQPPQGIELAATWRYIHSTVISAEAREFFFASSVTQPAVSYLDLAGQWPVTNRLTVRAGVNNVADKDPPLVVGPPPGVNGNAYAQVYDVLGRHVFVSATVRF